MAEATKRYAVVTGANKGIGFEICRQLASKWIVVVLTAREEKRGLEAVRKLQESGFSDDCVVFHQLDVVDPASVASLIDFVKTHFGKLDILVNNAGIAGLEVDLDALRSTSFVEGSAYESYSQLTTQTLELAEECLKINYYGTKRMVEGLIPLLQLSDYPRIINVSSGAGKLKYIPSERVKGILNDPENLTERKVDELLSEFMKDFKEGSLEKKGWPPRFSAYTVSKAAVNAYTRILARKYPNFCINCVSPGFVKTDINYHSGTFSVEEGAQGPVWLALLHKGGPSGLFFDRKEESSF